MATVKIKLNTQRETKMGYPLVFQIIHKRKRKFIATPYYLKRAEFSSIRQAVITRSRSLNKLLIFRDINIHLNKEHQKLLSIIASLSSIKNDFEVKDIVNAYTLSSNLRCPLNYISQLADEFLIKGNDGTAKAYLSTKNKLSAYAAENLICFDKIDSAWIHNFETYLKTGGAKPNTVNFYLRIFRASYNKAINDGIVSGEKRPFKNLVISNAKTAKKAISKEQIKRIADIDLSVQPKLDLARDIFIFSFLARGMPFVDCVLLKKSNIVSGNIIYERHKTNQKLEIKISDAISDIISKYNSSSKYVLPLINPNSNKSEYEQYRSVLRQQNKYLKSIGEHIGIELLSTYTARHSWATIAKYHGVPLAVISEGLGHSTQRTTYNYLAALDPSVLNNANEIITKF